MEKPKHEEAKKQESRMNKDKDAKNINKDEELAEKNQKIEDLTDTLKRLQAEFENHKKRTEKEKAEFMKYSQAEVMLKLLPVLDTFEIALKNTKDHEKFARGMEMLYAQFYSALESCGLRPIKALNEKFDPYRHEVLLKEECNRDDDTIIDELQKGYMLHDRVLRHSKVKISCRKEAHADNK
ncbi:nucleotide exchange factor GrpE [Candidatus Woesearchaeota archaeon]|nr:nucleotide exchange factor GrpE [Candidatus Woesearchaeota archaeon]